jgi:hypothetical protein
MAQSLLWKNKAAKMIHYNSTNDTSIMPEQYRCIRFMLPSFRLHYVSSFAHVCQLSCLKSTANLISCSGIWTDLQQNWRAFYFRIYVPPIEMICIAQGTAKIISYI